jgi:hypothetical protein
MKIKVIKSNTVEEVEKEIDALRGKFYQINNFTMPWVIDIRFHSTKNPTKAKALVICM